MERLIYADEAIKRINEYEIHAPDYMSGWAAKLVNAVKDDMKEVISEIQTVDAVPIRHGRWIRGITYPHYIFCSNCYRTYVPNDESEMWKDQTRLPRTYCPECGALMDEVKHDNN